MRSILLEIDDLLQAQANPQRTIVDFREVEVQES